MALFFYGTLMDVDVVAKVLARPFAERELVPAFLRGWRRLAVRNASYPVILPDPASRVEGRLLARPASVPRSAECSPAAASVAVSAVSSFSPAPTFFSLTNEPCEATVNFRLRATPVSRSECWTSTECRGGDRCPANPRYPPAAGLDHPR